MRRERQRSKPEPFDRVASELAKHLSVNWSRGDVSAGEIQKCTSAHKDEIAVLTAAGVRDSILACSQTVKELANMGTAGNYSNNVHTQIVSWLGTGDLQHHWSYRTLRKLPGRVARGLKLRAHSLRALQVPPSPPEEVVSNAPTRVAKLEAAMAALGESDPTYSTLQEALKKAKAQVHVRPVDERIVSAKTFIERAKKRIGCCRDDVAWAQRPCAGSGEAPVGGAKSSTGRSTFHRGVRGFEEVPPTLPANFAHELAELRACVEELRREITEVRSEFHEIWTWLCMVMISSVLEMAMTSTGCHRN